jgi:seryl-tRNA synthetase
MATTKEIGEGLTFEKIWAAIQATDAQIKATDAQMKATDAQMKATDERLKAVIEETNKQIKETGERVNETTRQMQETTRQMQETDKRFGHFVNRFGEIVEYMVVPNLESKFNDLGFIFKKTYRDAKIVDREHGIFAEVDVFLENGDKVMIVEIKTKPSIEDINDHIKRMEKLRAYADLRADTRKYLGAVAGAVFGDSEKAYALGKGFYVVEPSGDTFNIIEPTGDYHPREW